MKTYKQRGETKQITSSPGLVAGNLTKVGAGIVWRRNRHNLNQHSRRDSG